MYHLAYPYSHLAHIPSILARPPYLSAKLFLQPTHQTRVERALLSRVGRQEGPGERGMEFWVEVIERQVVCLQERVDDTVLYSLKLPVVTVVKNGFERDVSDLNGFRHMLRNSPVHDRPRPRAQETLDSCSPFHASPPHSLLHSLHYVLPSRSPAIMTRSRP